MKDRNSTSWIAIIGVGLAAAGAVAALLSQLYFTRVKAAEHIGDFKAHTEKPAHDQQLIFNMHHQEEMRDFRRSVQTMNENIIRLQRPSRRREMERIEYEDDFSRPRPPRSLSQE